MPKKPFVPAVLLALAIVAGRASAEETHLTLEPDPQLLADYTQSAVIEAPGGDWHFRAGVNVWAGAITGTAGNGPTEVDVDAGLEEIFDNGTWGLEFVFEAGTGPWSILFDGMWMHLGDDPTTKNNGSFRADFDGDFGFLDFAGGYEFYRRTVLGKQAALDGLLGFRWTRVDTSIQVKEGPRPSPGAPRPMRDTDKDFVDPYLGLRSRWYLSDKYTLITTGTVGGVGVGSDLLATAQIMLEYRLNDTWSVLGGYRAYYYEYDQDFEWSVLMHGPVIGVAARF